MAAFLNSIPGDLRDVLFFSPLLVSALIFKFFWNKKHNKS